MTWARTWQTVLGMLALLAALALTSPGVQLARAGEGDASATASEQGRAPATPATPAARAAPAPEPVRAAPAPEAPVCRATSPESQSEVDVLRLQQQLAAQLAALRAAPPGESPPPDGIELNNRGYNYGSAPGR